MQLVPLSKMSAPKSRLLIAGIAAVGASLIALSPMSQSAGLHDVTHRAVGLASTEASWTDLVAAAGTNLTNLESGASTASTELSTALSHLSAEFGGQISNALDGFGAGVQQSLGSGWWAPDDQYVFGIFGGTLTDRMTGATETNSLLNELSTLLSAGNYEQAFSDVDTWYLETLDHTFQPLLAPLLDETSGHGPTAITTLSIPVELSQIQTNLLETFANYTELKNFSDALLSPQLGLGFALSGDIQGIAADLSSGDYTAAMTALENLPSDLTNAVFNGWDGGAGEPFLGLLYDTGSSTGGLLQELLVTLPEQLAAAL